MIDFNRRKYRFEHKGRITREIDLNKITKRLVFGDEYFGNVEKSYGGYKAYNGNLTDGVIPKLEKGWLDVMVARWKEVYKLTKDMNLLECKLLCNILECRDVYPIELTATRKYIRYCLPYLRDIDIPESIKLCILFECLDEKFGHKNTDVKLANRLEKLRCRNIKQEMIQLEP